MRTTLDAVRDGTGRIATAAGTAAAAAVLIDPDTAGPALIGAAVATAAGLMLLPTGRGHHPHHRHTAAVLYALPGAGLTGLLIAERVTCGAHWGEGVAIAVWSAGTWLLRPARAARRMLTPQPPREPAVDVVPAGPPPHPAAVWWAEHAAVDGGAAPGTVLEDVVRTGEWSMRAVIRSAAAGVPVPDVSIRRLSAAMDVPEDLIGVGPVPHRGASVRLLTVGRQAEATDPAAVWAQRIAPLAMPGAAITAINTGRMTRPETAATGGAL